MKIVNSLIFASLLICQQIAFADVLFIDLNMSSKEIDAARRGAAARGEKLIVIPNISEQARKKIETAQSKVYQFTGFLATQCGQNARGENNLSAVEVSKQKKCAEVAEKEAQAKNELTKIKKIELKDGPLDLATELKKIQASKVNLSSMVISGHDGHGQFSGVNGAFSYLDVQKAFDTSKPLGENIRSLALWGCESATPGSAAYQWRNILPKIEVIAGFDGVAPSNNRKAGHDYLENFLKQEKILTAAKDQNELRAAFKRLEGVNVVTASLCNDKFYVSHKKSFDLSAEVKKCLGSTSMESLNKMSCILNGFDTCKKMSQEQIKSESMKYYNTVASKTNCENSELRLENNIDLMVRQQVFALANFDQVMVNFKKNHASEIQSISAVVQELNADRKYNINFDSANDWNSYVQLHDEINKLILDAEKSGLSIFNPKYEKIMYLKHAITNLHQTFSDLNVPFSYNDKHSSEKLNYFSAFDPKLKKETFSKYLSWGADRIARDAIEEIYNSNPQLMAQMMSARTNKSYNEARQKLQAATQPQIIASIQNFIDLEKKGLNRPEVLNIFEKRLSEAKEKI